MKLSFLRYQIDELDSKILKLFLKRISICRKIAEFKKSNHIPIENSSRENEILKTVKLFSGEDFIYSEELFKKIFSICKKAQKAEMEDNLHE